MFLIFLELDGRDVLVGGGGAVAESKTKSLLDTGARVTVVAPSIGFAWTHPNDLDNAWFVIAAATRETNRLVATAAEKRHQFVIAVDDKASCSAYGGAVLRRAVGPQLGSSRRNTRLGNSSRGDARRAHGLGHPGDRSPSA